MSSYKKSLVGCLLLFLFSGCSVKTDNIENKDTNKRKFTEVKTKKFEPENQYIILALESESQRLYYDARQLYFDLFENTNNYEYLVKCLIISTNLKDFESVKTLVSEYLKDNIKEEEVMLRLYSFSLFKLEEKQKAILYGEKLISLYPNSINYELLGSLYLDDKQYLKAYQFFEKSFILDNSSTSLQTLTNIQYFNLSQKKEAIEKIENYFKSNPYEFNLAVQLASFYEQEKQKDKLISHLKNVYYFYKKSDNQLLVNKAKILFVKATAIDNIPLSIEFLEQNGEEDEILLNLYKVSNQNQKAYKLVEKLYEKTNNLDYLGQMAVLEFEMSENKKDVLESVISKFDKVLQTTNNSVYQNYLAYILIDFEVDINKGLRLVKKALLQQPNNIAYIDTLAWGEYKIKNCKEANNQMKKVVDEVGLDDEEIKFHWEKIKECSSDIR